MKLTPLNIIHCLVYCTMPGRTNCPVPSLCPKTHKLLGGSPWEEQEVSYNPSYKLSCSIADWLCPKTNLKIDFSNLRAFGSGYRRDILLGRGTQGPVQLGISILMASARAVRAPAVLNIHGISLLPCCAEPRVDLNTWAFASNMFFSDWRSSSTWVPIGLTGLNPIQQSIPTLPRRFPTMRKARFRWRFWRGLDQPLLNFSVLRSLRRQQMTGKLKVSPTNHCHKTEYNVILPQHYRTHNISRYLGWKKQMSPLVAQHSPVAAFFTL